MANYRLKTILAFAAIVVVSFLSGARLHACGVGGPVSIKGQEQSPSANSEPSTSVAKPQPVEKKVTAYTLPPETYKKARDLSRIHFRFALISFVYGLFVLWLILQLRLAPKYRDWAEKFSSKHWFQAAVFMPLFLMTSAVLGLPADIYQNWVERKFGISVQGWGSWAWDWTKGQFIAIFLGIMLISTLYVVIRNSRRRPLGGYDRAADIELLTRLPIRLLVFGVVTGLLLPGGVVPSIA